MWLVRDIDGLLKIFGTCPARNVSGYYSDDLIGIFPKDKLYPELDKFLVGYENLKFEDEPVEIIILPSPTEKTIKTNSIYHNIYELGVNECEKFYQRLN